jgi:hypothetical protein
MRLAAPWSRRRAAGAAILGFALAPPAIAQADPGGGVAAHGVDVREAAFGDARIRERETGFSLWSPEFAFDPFAFRMAANYAYTRYEFQGVPTRDRDLHQLHVPLQWRGDDSHWRVVLTPVIAASSNVFKDLLERASGDDFDLYGRWQVERWTDTALGWQVALVRDAAFGAPRLYPAAALLWRGEHVSAALGLPESSVRWNPRGNLALGAAVFPIGGRWHVVSDERGGAEFDYLARAWRGAVTADWSPWPRLKVSVQAGVEFARHYQFEDDTGARVDRDAGSAGYLRLALSFGY